MGYAGPIPPERWPRQQTDCSSRGRGGTQCRHLGRHCPHSSSSSPKRVRFQGVSYGLTLPPAPRTRSCPASQSRLVPTQRRSRKGLFCFSSPFSYLCVLAIFVFLSSHLRSVTNNCCLHSSWLLFLLPVSDPQV